MNKQQTPRIGDKVFLSYGVCGSDEGILYGIEETTWGPNYRVKLNDGSFTICGSLSPYHNQMQIGSYYQPTSKLR